MTSCDQNLHGNEKNSKESKQLKKRTKLSDFHHMISKLTTRPGGIGIKSDIQTNGIEKNQKTGPHFHGDRVIQWGENSLFSQWF